LRETTKKGRQNVLEVNCKNKLEIKVKLIWRNDQKINK